ncbi:hypothetical protein TRVL_02980 [Trypanosoma vivax]|uniref:Uncharacterized protein n=1 Tax=Trypanosoma vivax (strain Y486) TaxID=1055687 RepID=G0TYL2_TRYVY|nr:hypothetical protein TRVL_02980 [Trypanosoma vivax]CCC49059.1 hypothetical protein TVY486_0703930 [Trypanosoma vivax Y486]
MSQRYIRRSLVCHEHKEPLLFHRPCLSCVYNSPGCGTGWLLFRRGGWSAVAWVWRPFHTSFYGAGVAEVACFCSKSPCLQAIGFSCYGNIQELQLATLPEPATPKFSTLMNVRVSLLLHPLMLFVGATEIRMKRSRSGSFQLRKYAFVHVRFSVGASDFILRVAGCTTFSCNNGPFLLLFLLIYTHIGFSFPYNG